MSGLPTLIPPQTLPLGTDEKGKPIFADINWYLFLYNLSVQTFGTNGGGGSTPASPYDALDAVNLSAQGADIPQAFLGLANLAALDTQNGVTWSADLPRINRALQNLQALLPGILLQGQVHQAQPAQTVTAGASPFTYTALANGVLSVTAGAVSSISIIRQGVSVATGIGSSSANAISTLTDEKGSGGSPGFVAGVDFTPGTTTTLTLSRTYASAADLWVAFDGSEQGANTYTLSGTTLTFSAAIPSGVTDVFVKGASSSAISSSGGLVPVSRLDKVQITYTAAPTLVFLPQ